jgi:hypothetical protein
MSPPDSMRFKTALLDPGICPCLEEEMRARQLSAMDALIPNSERIGNLSNDSSIGRSNGSGASKVGEITEFNNSDRFGESDFALKKWV